MVDTKATTEAKKEHEAKKSALNLAKHFRRSAGTSRMYGYFLPTTNQKISIQLSREAGG
jgi:hypothetical protein